MKQKNIHICIIPLRNPLMQDVIMMCRHGLSEYVNMDNCELAHGQFWFRLLNFKIKQLANSNNTVYKSISSNANIACYSVCYIAFGNFTHYNYEDASLFTSDIFLL